MNNEPEITIDPQEDPIILTHRYVKGPYPFLPGKKIFKGFLKAERAYEQALKDGRKVTAERLFKKGVSMARRFKKATGIKLN